MITKFKMFLESNDNTDIIEIDGSEYNDGMQHKVVIDAEISDIIIASFSKYNPLRMGKTCERVGSVFTSFINDAGDMVLICVDDDYWLYLMYVHKHMTNSNIIKYFYKIDISGGYGILEKVPEIIYAKINSGND